mmetsp:Transcript_9405/g.17724  ORF Transcript_9405/g.17724 Transcript_9405/m.17724 type:complete len:91 (-) Transcript_9405:1227-1499(-)
MPVSSPAQPIPRTKGRRTKTEAINKGKSGAKVKKAEKPVVGPFLLAFFLFVVVGSAVLQIFRVLFDSAGDAAPKAPKQDANDFSQFAKGG